MSKGLLFDLFVFPVGGYAAPLFAIISGLSAQLSLQALTTEQSALSRFGKVRFAKRGLLLFVCSSVINIVVGPILHLANISVLNWSVFQLIGVGYFIIPWLPSSNIAAVGLIALPLALTEIDPSLQRSLPFIFHGFAPIVPWLSLFLAGFLIGPTFVSALQYGRRRHCILVVAAGLGMIFPLRYILEALGQPFNDWDKTLGVNITTYSVYVGCFLLMLAACGYLFDVRQRKHLVVEVVMVLGQYALTIYYLQYLSIIGVGALLRAVFTAPIHLSVAVFPFLLVSAFLLLHLASTAMKKRHKCTLEWLFREASNRSWRIVLVPLSAKSRT